MSQPISASSSDDFSAHSANDRAAARFSSGESRGTAGQKTSAWIHLIPPLVALTIASSMTATNPELRARILGLSEAERKAQVLQQVEQHIQSDYYRTDVPDNLFDAAIDGMVNALGDRYTTYFNERELADFDRSTTGKLTGIGISVMLGDDQFPTVVTPYPDTPAYEAGIRPGDKFIRIDDKDPREADFHTVVVDQWLRGLEGTTVTLLVRHADGREQTVIVTRRSVKIPSITIAKMLGDADPTAKATNVGYVRITQFQRDTAKDFAAAVKNLQSQGMKNLIVDVRNNRGGLLFEVRDIVGMFLPENSLVVFTAGKEFRGESYVARADAANSFADDLGLVILADRTSASASEILVGALQDHQRAIIVGETTYGKGLVQNVFPLGDGKRALKVTIARYFTPSGRVIQREHAYRTCPTCAERYLATENFLFCPRDGTELADDPATPGDGYRGGIAPDILIELSDDEYELLNYAIREQEVFGGPPVREGRAKRLNEADFVDRQLMAGVAVFGGDTIPQSTSPPTALATASNK